MTTLTADPGLIDRIKRGGLLVFSRYDSDADFEFEDEIEEIDHDVQG